MSGGLRFHAFGLLTALAAAGSHASVPLEQRAKEVAHHQRESWKVHGSSSLKLLAAKAEGARVELIFQSSLTAADSPRLKRESAAEICRSSTVVTRHAAAGGVVAFRYQDAVGKEIATVILNQDNCIRPRNTEGDAERAAKAVAGALSALAGPGKSVHSVSLRGVKEVVVAYLIPGIETEAAAKKAAADSAHVRKAITSSKARLTKDVCDGPVYDHMRLLIDEGATLTLQYVAVGVKIGEFSVDGTLCGGAY